MDNPLPSPDVLESQRRYAALVYDLRGYLAESNQARAPVAFSFSPRRVVEGDTVKLEGEFNSAPLMASIGDVQLNVQSDRTYGPLKLNVLVPVGTPTGYIRLVWPDKTLSSSEVLTVDQRLEHITTLEDDAYRWCDDGKLRVCLPEQPTSVQFGAINIRPTDLEWVPRKLMVAIRLPQNAPDGQLVIRTATKIYQTSCALPVETGANKSTS